MALTLDMSADMELLLDTQAAMNGQDITTYLLKLVEKDIGAEMDEFSGLADLAGSVGGIQAGLDDVDAGRTYSMEEVFGQLEARAQERRAEREGKRAQ